MSSATTNHQSTWPLETFLNPQLDGGEMVRLLLLTVGPFLDGDKFKQSRMLSQQEEQLDSKSSLDTRDVCLILHYMIARDMAR